MCSGGRLPSTQPSPHSLFTPAPPPLQAEGDELNYILCTINAPAMVEVCSRATMEMLTQRRLPELTTETRHAPRLLHAAACLLAACWFQAAGRLGAECWTQTQLASKDSCQPGMVHACLPALLHPETGCYQP